MKIYGQLEKAGLEILSNHPPENELFQGRLWFIPESGFYFYTGEEIVKLSEGGAPQNIPAGISPPSSGSVRLHSQIHYEEITSSGQITVPENVTQIYAELVGGGGGGGGGYGYRFLNRAGGRVGQNGEILRRRLEVVPGQVFVIIIGSGGAGGISGGGRSNHSVSPTEEQKQRIAGRPGERTVIMSENIELIAVGGLGASATGYFDESGEPNHQRGEADTFNPPSGFGPYNIYHGSGGNGASESVNTGTRTENGREFNVRDGQRGGSGVVRFWWVSE